MVRGSVLRCRERLDDNDDDNKKADKAIFMQNGGEMRLAERFKCQMFTKGIDSSCVLLYCRGDSTGFIPELSDVSGLEGQVYAKNIEKHGGESNDDAPDILGVVRRAHHPDLTVACPD